MSPAKPTNERGNGKRFVAALDIGTTIVRCCVYNKQAQLVASHNQQLQVTCKEKYASEVEPEHLWDCVRGVIGQCFEGSNGNVLASDIVSLGIATHRNTFMLWDKHTGKPLSSFITWKDSRCSATTDKLNNKLIIKMIRFVAGLLYFLTRSKRLLLASIMRFMNAMVCTRLLWLLDKNPELRSGVESGDVAYGCIESWLLLRLSGGKQRQSVTDVSLASSTGMLDPFQVDWSYSLLKIVGVPLQLLPQLTDTQHMFVDVDPELFGDTFPVTALMGDQQAASYGVGCLAAGDVTLSLGTGAFIDINTGPNAHASIKGLYPVIGWRTAEQLVYLAEAHCYDNAAAIHWAQTIGLFDDVRESADIARSVPDSAGAYFIPAFSGLQAPINDPSATTAFFGMGAETTRAHLVRAVLEAVAFRLYQIFQVMLAETDDSNKLIRCCGGVSRNDFILQCMADLSERPVHRVADCEFAAAWGVAFMSGQTVDFWPSDSTVKDYVTVERVFEPADRQRRLAIQRTYEQWSRALQRTLRWNQDQ